jgi:hypothetical protein
MPYQKKMEWLYDKEHLRKKSLPKIIFKQNFASHYDGLKTVLKILQAFVSASFFGSVTL